MQLLLSEGAYINGGTLYQLTVIQFSLL